MKKILVAALLFLLSTVAITQTVSETRVSGPSQPLSPDDGKITENLYQNYFFHFTLKFPAGWYAHGKETSKRVMELGSSSLKDKGVVSNAAAEVAEKHTFNLLTVFEKPIGTPGLKTNRALLVLAEDVSFAPGVKNGEDYLLNAEVLLEKAGWTKVLLEQTQIAGIQYGRLVMKNPSNFFESMTATIKQGYAVGFIAIADSQEKLADANAAIATCKFDSENQPSTTPAP